MHKCNELESLLQQATNDNSILSTKQNVLQDDHDRISKDYELLQHKLKVCKAQLEGIQQLLVQKEDEKEVGVVIKIVKLILLLSIIILEPKMPFEHDFRRTEEDSM